MKNRTLLNSESNYYVGIGKASEVTCWDLPPSIAFITQNQKPQSAVEADRYLIITSKSPLFLRKERALCVLPVYN